MRIWKFPVQVDESFEIEMPLGARVLSVQMQSDEPCLWALANEAEPTKERRRFALAGTGSPLPTFIDKYHFVGTFQMAGGKLVFHLFEAP